MENSIAVRKITKKDFSRLPNRWARRVALCDLSPTALKVLFTIIGKVQTVGKINAWAYFSWRELASIVTPESTRAVKLGDYRTLKEAFKELRQVEIDHSFVNRLHHEEKTTLYLFQQWSVDLDTGDCRVQLTTGFQKYLDAVRLAKPGDWARVSTQDVIKLRSTQQINLYILRCSLVGLSYPGARVIHHTDLRRKMGLRSDYYNDWSRLRDAVNRVAKEVNRILKTELHLYPLPKRNGFQVDDATMERVTNGDETESSENHTAAGTGRREVRGQGNRQGDASGRTSPGGGTRKNGRIHPRHLRSYAGRGYE